MANLTEASNFWANIFRLETTTPALGGDPVFSGANPTTGYANAQAKQLADRTQALKNAHLNNLDANRTHLSLTAAVGTPIDLNTLTASGFYRIAVTTTAHLTNKPTTVGPIADGDVVFVHVYTDGTHTIQRLKHMKGLILSPYFDEYCRSYINNLDIPAVGWTAWATVSDTGFVELKKTEAVTLAAPPGVVAAFARNSAPTGWLKANGAAVSRSTYSQLFAAIGTTFGAGDGSTTFNLPDLRGEFVRGWDDGRGIDTGRVFGSWQEDLLKNHQHYTYTQTNGAITNTGATSYTTSTGNANTDNVHITNMPVTGGGSETRPRNRALLYCIKF